MDRLEETSVGCDLVPQAAGACEPTEPAPADPSADDQADDPIAGQSTPPPRPTWCKTWRAVAPADEAIAEFVLLLNVWTSLPRHIRLAVVALLHSAEADRDPRTR